MGKIFSLDNPFFRFMEHVADFFILNILTVLCSLPLFTAGAALTAHHKVMQDLVMGFEQPVCKSYFRAFSGNFKQATAPWLITVAVLALLAADVFLIYLYLDGIATMLYVILAVIAVVILGTAIYAFAMIARYENTLKEHLRNSFILAVGHLPKTLLMLLVCVAVTGMAVLSMLLSFNLMLLLVTFGISLIVYAHALILKPVFLMLEQADKEDNRSENEVYSL